MAGQPAGGEREQTARLSEERAVPSDTAGSRAANGAVTRTGCSAEHGADESLAAVVEIAPGWFDKSLLVPARKSREAGLYSRGIFVFMFR